MATSCMVAPARPCEAADEAALLQDGVQAGAFAHAAGGCSVDGNKENRLATGAGAKRKASGHVVDGNARKFGPSTGQHVEDYPSEGALAPCQAHCSNPCPVRSSLQCSLTMACLVQVLLNSRDRGKAAIAAVCGKDRRRMNTRLYSGGGGVVQRRAARVWSV